MSNVNVSIRRASIPTQQILAETTPIINLSRAGRIPLLARTIINAVVQDQGILTLFTNRYFGNAYNASSDTDTVDEMWIKYAVMLRQQRSAQIVGNYTGSTNPGSYFTVRINKPLASPNGIALTNDQSNLMVISVTPAPNNCQDVVFSVSGTAIQNATFDAAQIAYGKYLYFSHSAWGEGSVRGQGIIAGQEQIDYLNYFSTERTELTITGDAMTQGYDVDVVQASVQGSKSSVHGFVPDIITNSGQSLLREHYLKVGNKLWFEAPNFNYATGEIISRDAQNNVVPMSAGLRFQMWNNAGMKVTYNPNNPDTFIPAIDAAVDWIAKEYRQWDLKIIGFGGSGARTVLRLAGQQWIQAKANIMINADSSGKINVTTIPRPVGVETIPTRNGDVDFIHIPALDQVDRTQPDNMILIGGATYPIEACHLYLKLMVTFEDGKRSLYLVSKGKDGIDRAMVTGMVAGLSGTQGSSAMSKFIGDGVNFQKLMSLQGMPQISNGQDGNTYHILTQAMICDRLPNATAILVAQPNA